MRKNTESTGARKAQRSSKRGSRKRKSYSGSWCAPGPRISRARKRERAIATARRTGRSQATFGRARAARTRENSNVAVGVGVAGVGFGSGRGASLDGSSVGDEGEGVRWGDGAGDQGDVVWIPRFAKVVVVNFFGISEAERLSVNDQNGRAAAAPTHANTRRTRREAAE